MLKFMVDLFIDDMKKTIGIKANTRKEVSEIVQEIFRHRKVKIDRTKEIDEELFSVIIEEQSEDELNPELLSVVVYAKNWIDATNEIRKTSDAKIVSVWDYTGKCVWHHDRKALIAINESDNVGKGKYWLYTDGFFKKEMI